MPSELYYSLLEKTKWGACLVIVGEEPFEKKRIVIVLVQFTPPGDGRILLNLFARSFVEYEPIETDLADCFRKLFEVNRFYDVAVNA